MQNQTPSFWSFILCPIKSSSFREFLMTLLHVMYGFAPFSQPKILATPMHLTMCKVHTRCGRCIFVLLCARSRVVTYNIAKMQNIRCIASTLKVLWYEVWNGIWKKILVWNKIRNGRFWVWNGRKLQYGIWKNRLPFHSLLVYERVRALAPLMRALIRVRAISGK